MRKAAFLTLSILLAVSVVGVAQDQPALNSAEIFLRIKKLKVLGCALYIAAHPDDENSRLIPYLAQDRLLRTGYLSMTRGDGGQNLIGDEQGVELGLIRTQEMLAARRIDGAEQFFTRAFDFGFSKSTEEALRIWDKEKILSDVVWVIRKFRPDVLITRFPEDSRAGHGHHSASAQLAHEAFFAAGDKTKFPEQFQYGVEPWKPTRIVWNSFNFGPGLNTTSEDQLKINVGIYNPILARSYGEIAADSRSQHKTQGGALTRSRGETYEYFSPVAGEPAHKDLLEGINLGWSRVEGGSAIEPLIDRLIQTYSLEHPEKSVPGLVALYQTIQQLKDGYWKGQKLKEVQQLVEACSGLFLEAVVHNPYLVQGGSIPVSVALIAQLPVQASGEEIQIEGWDSLYHTALEPNKNYFLSPVIAVAPAHAITQPYWLVADMDPGHYNVSDQALIGLAQSPPAFIARFRIRVEGQDFWFSRSLQYKYTDPVRGELYEPVTVIPPVTGQMAPELVLFPALVEKSLELYVKSQPKRPEDLQISLTNSQRMQLTQKENLRNAYIRYGVRPLSPSTQVFFSSLQQQVGGKELDIPELRTISYNHIPRIDYFRPARTKIVVADVKTAGKRIGYIDGAGDKVREALEQMGYEVTLLNERDVNPDNCRQFDAILTGVRAYNVHPWLTEKFDVLMDYVHQGGNLIVQYNTGSNMIGGARANISPYPLAISRGRVTDEQAAVRFLLPDHPVLNFPNTIGPQDFDGWIQERGIYFAEPVDSHFQAILAMKDPGEQEQQGSLIVADYGAGKFVYTGLVFFRELPAGVPGAYRLMANIIALNQKKGF
jgi:LmbE family N-acetylglucosaminyl deacetylase